MPKSNQSVLEGEKIMIGIVATLKAKEGMEADFEEAAMKLVAAVNANEPGCEFYALHRTDDPQTYVMMERYKDMAAVEAHRQTDHMKELGGAMGAFMAGRPDVQILHEVE